MNNYIIKGYLNNYGFCIKKCKINPSILLLLQKYFRVKPESNYEEENENIKYFNVYYEDEKYIVLPKFTCNLKIDIKKLINLNAIIFNNIEYQFIVFEINKFKYKKQLINFNFNGKLRDYQHTIINEIFNKFGIKQEDPSNHKISQSFPKGGLIKLSCGGGKCLAKNTPVLMYNGLIKMVQDIKIDDKLMGDDSMPRNILSLASGREIMYKIYTDNNEFYIVNSSHILSLIDINTNNIIDIAIQDYLQLTNNNNLYGFRVPIIFSYKEIEVDPYLFGLALGGKFDNSLLEFLNNYDIINSKKIPYHYKCNSRQIQLKIIAGIIDTIGFIDIDNYMYIITSMSINLINDIIFIVRSLGFKIIKYYTINNYTIKISGNIDEIPVKNIYFIKNINIKDNNLFYKIKVEKLEEDNYYGFEIDGNKRFVLGDFTVTHNTVLAIYLSHALKLKTLIIVHKEFLMDQWVERFKQYTNAKIGIIRQNKVDIEGKDVVIGMLRSISIKDYDIDIFNQFGLVIYDEVHHLGSRVDSQALLKTSAEYTIGLSATPERSDGLLKIINWHVGDILYQMEKKYDYRVLVKKIFFRSDDILFKEKKRWFQGRMAPCNTAMFENIINIKTRNQLIINIIDTLKNIGRKILVLSYRVEHLQELKNTIDKKILEDGENHIYNSYYYMGSTKKGEKKMAEKDGHIIFATMQLAEEGLDISHLDTILFALPVSVQKDKNDSTKIKSDKSLIQSIGRILRNDKLENLTQIPLVIDISDLFSIYSTWSNKRNEVYYKKNWYVQNYHWYDLDYIYEHNHDKNKNPMNIIFDDIEDENFIENNLIIKNDLIIKDNIKSIENNDIKYTFGNKNKYL